MVGRTRRTIIRKGPVPIHRSRRSQRKHPHTTLSLATKIGKVYNEEANFKSWWRQIGIPLGILLQKAEYSTESQLRHLDSFRDLIAPNLGPAGYTHGCSDQWRSFMTDSSTPVELSWDWGCVAQRPSIRYSFEPIGCDAGTIADPLNRFAASHWIKEWRGLHPETDLSWYDHCSKELAMFDVSKVQQSRAYHIEAHQSRIFLAFDLHEHDAMLKAYFFPIFRAASDNETSLTTVAKTIASLPGRPQFPAFTAIQNYIMSSQDSSLNVEILSIDCDSPSESRVKVYIRSAATNLNSVRDILTLGKGNEEPSFDQGFSELQYLCNLVLPERADRSSTAELGHVIHRTAGLLYYFEFRSNQALPTAKLYLPVRHYGSNDYAIALGLKTYLEGRGQAVWAGQYLEAIKTIR